MNIQGVIMASKSVDKKVKLEIPYDEDFISAAMIYKLYGLDVMETIGRVVQDFLKTFRIDVGKLL